MQWSFAKEIGPFWNSLWRCYTLVLVISWEWSYVRVDRCCGTRSTQLRAQHMWHRWFIKINYKLWSYCHSYIQLLIERFSISSSSSWSWRVRRVSCSLILKMKLVPPSLPRSSYVPSSFWLIFCSACFGIIFVSILCTCAFQCNYFKWIMGLNLVPSVFW